MAKNGDDWRGLQITNLINWIKLNFSRNFSNRDVASYNCHKLSPFRYLEPGKPYTYTVQAVTSLGVKGPPSPPLTPEQGFCGNGIVEYSIGEECDDGNVRDSDGCNMQCKKEDVFHCTGASGDRSIIFLTVSTSVVLMKTQILIKVGD